MELLERDHMARPNIDDEIAKKWCKNFLKDLDPQKILLRKSRTSKSSWPRPRRSTTRFAKATSTSPSRLRPLPEAGRPAATRRSSSCLKQKPDFTIDETIVDDPDLTITRPTPPTPRSGGGRGSSSNCSSSRSSTRSRERRPSSKLKIRYATATGCSTRSTLVELLEIYLTSLTRTFDPHSSYIEPQDAGGHAQPAASSLARRDRRVASSRRTVTRSSRRSSRGWRPTRTAGSSPKTRSSASRRRTASEIDLVEKKLSDVVRYIRGTTRHQGPPDRPARRHQGAEDLRADPREDRAQRAARQGHRSSRAKGANGRSSKIGDHQPAGLLRRHRGPSCRAIPNAVSATEDCRKLLEELQARKASTP